jgi:hypothetical protein
MSTPKYLCKYLCFTRDHNLESALQTFQDRYHVNPKGYEYKYGILMVGPIPGSDLTVFDLTDERKAVALRDQNGDEFQLLMF